MTITLLTDFGTADYFVASMKGVILSASPAAEMVDITHDIPAHDVESAAFVLEAASATFPEGTVHLAVVDPGVGSARRPLIVSGRHLFVGPDNGLLSFVYDRDPTAATFEVTAEHLFRHPVSRTFHGRDIFAPIAAALSLGVPPATLGRRIHDPVRLPPRVPERGPDGEISGRILHVDRFGNLVTSLPSATLPPGAPFRLRLGSQDIRRARSFYAEGPEGELFVIAGSAGYLEVSLMGASAAERLGVSRGDPLTLHPAEGGARPPMGPGGAA